MRLLVMGPFRNAYLFRGAAMWVGIRGAFLVFRIVTIGLLVKLGVLVVIGLVVYVDARRRDEDLFLGNLGVSRYWIAAAALPIPAVLEFLVL